MSEGRAASPAAPVFIARQPIFDAGNRRVAYELLYRDSLTACDASNIGSVEGSLEAGSTSALHAVVSIGLQQLTPDATAFVNLARPQLTGELYRLFDPHRVVLELLESIDGDAEVVEACARAVDAGYTLALDDYDGRATLDVLLPFVRIVKLDVLNVEPATLAPCIARLRAMGIRVLAERVETAAARAAYAALGCELFQGYVFSRPETVDGRSLSVDQVAIVNAIGKLADETIADEQLADAFRAHPSLSIGLLRLVNAASFSARSVESIPHALRLVGREALSRWMMVMLVTSAAPRTPVTQERMMAALVRARFAERVCEATGAGDPEAHFLTGLLSQLDALLGEPMPALVARLPLAADVRDALLHRTGPLAAVLGLVQEYEDGEWSAVDRALDTLGLLDVLGAQTHDLGVMFGEASDWAAQQLRA